MDSQDGRDRDVLGQARSARARDKLGRPLPRGQAGVPPLPEQNLPPAQSLAKAQELLDRGWPFQAHEVLEAAWKAAPETERQLWQGLAQLAVAVTHAARGNTHGAARLLERGRAAISPYAVGPPHQVDVVGLVNWVGACLERLNAGAESIPLEAPRLEAQ